MLAAASRMIAEAREQAFSLPNVRCPDIKGADAEQWMA